MPTTTAMETPDQQFRLDELATEHGYRDRHHAAGTVLRRPARQLRTTGLSRDDAARVIAELEPDDDTEEPTRGDLASADPERKWALSSGALAGAAWMVLPGAVVTWVASALAAVLGAFWALDQLEHCIPIGHRHRSGE